MVDEDLTGKVIGCAMDVHRELGPGYLEKVYENALAFAIQSCGLSVDQQVAIPAHFRGVVVGDFVADLIVEGRLIVELKAVSGLLPVHEAQLVSYLKSTGIDMGLLMNFGTSSLQFKRKYRIYRNPVILSGDEESHDSFESRNPVNPDNPVILSKTI
jgi:GxxExxY protein